MAPVRCYAATMVSGTGDGTPSYRLFRYDNENSYTSQMVRTIKHAKVIELRARN